MAETQLVSATLTMIPPDKVGACTLCIHVGTDVWRKTYRNTDGANAEARSLGLLSTLSGKPVAVAVDLETLASLGYSK